SISRRRSCRCSLIVLGRGFSSLTGISAWRLPKACVPHSATHTEGVSKGILLPCLNQRWPAPYHGRKGRRCAVGLSHVWASARRMPSSSCAPGQDCLSPERASGGSCSSQWGSRQHEVLGKTRMASTPARLEPNESSSTPV